MASNGCDNYLLKNDGALYGKWNVVWIVVGTVRTGTADVAPNVPLSTMLPFFRASALSACFRCVTSWRTSRTEFYRVDPASRPSPS